MLCEVCQGIFRGASSSYIETRAADGRILRSEVTRYEVGHHVSRSRLERSAAKFCYICHELWQALKFRADKLRALMEASQNHDYKSFALHDTRQRNISFFSRYDILVQERDILASSFRREEERYPRLIVIRISREFFLDAPPMAWSRSYESSDILFRFDLERCKGLQAPVMLNDIGSLVRAKPAITHKIEDSNGSRSSLGYAHGWLKTCIANHQLCNQLTTAVTKSRPPTRLVELGQPSPDKVRVRRLGPEETVSCVTLSHCWGTAKFMTHTASTSKRLEEGIQITVLPKTFQDAITVAIALGTSFIWIDSLCVIQDSSEDWQREAPLMAHVYGGALCNIAASDSTDCHQGALYLRNTELVKPCVVSSSWTDCTNSKLVVCSSQFWANSLEDSPLEKRAWVKQELLLAPRILHLNKRQLFWECYELKACETFPLGLPHAVALATGKALISSCGSHLSAAKNPPVGLPRELLMPQRASMEFWYETVRKYTACDLTNSEDKLIALSGVAQAVQWALDSEYVAGLWKRRLAHQLVWSCEGHPRREIEYRAPSWSWASVDGMVTPGSTESWDVNIKIDILDVHVDAVNGNPFGQVVGGYIRVRGPLIAIELTMDTKQTSVVSNPGPMVCQTSSLDEGRSSFEVQFDRCESGTRFHCLPIEFGKCLLLKPTGNAKGQFRRCGYVDFGENLKLVQSEDWIEYEECKRKDKYTISIV